jgi:hypothetical protein
VLAANGCRLGGNLDVWMARLQPRSCGFGGREPEGTGLAHQAKQCTGGSDGDRSVGCILPAGALVIAARPLFRVAGRSRRAAYRSTRQRKLSAEQVQAIWAEAGGRSLRELAADFGVSHETIRTVVRQGGSV